MRRNVTHKYNSVETDINDINLNDYNPKVLSPISKLVYVQWTKDKKDDLLIHGYFRECNITTQPLSSDISKMIAFYYTKQHTKGYLKRKIIQLQQQRDDIRRKNLKTSGLYLVLFFSVIILLAFAFGTDIAALITVNKYDCDQTLNKNSIIFGINDFLFIGSIAHIAIVGFLLCIVAVYFFCSDTGYPQILFACFAVVGLLFISWSIVGSLLYSEMTEKESYKQCSDVLLSWIVLKLITYIVIVMITLIRLFCWMIPLEASVCSILVAIIFSVDIAGLIVVGLNDCNLSLGDGSKWFEFGVNEFLLIGCGVHLGVGIGVAIFFVCTYCYVECSGGDVCECIVACPFYTITCIMTSMALFLISWNVIGCMLYSEMDESNKSNKQCADVTFTLIVVRFMECILMKPFIGNILYILV